MKGLWICILPLVAANAVYIDQYIWEMIMINHQPFILIFKNLKVKDEYFKIDTTLNKHHIKTYFNVFFSLLILNPHVDLPEREKFCSGFCAPITSFITQVVHAC